MAPNKMGGLKDQAEREKLEAERDHLQAQAARLRLETEAIRREISDEMASDNRTHIYPFYTEINRTTVYKAAEVFSFWSRRDPGCDIELILNTPGGDVMDGLALFDTIQHVKQRGHKFTVVGVGAVASMGAVLLQAGTERVLGKYAQVLIHELSAQGGGGKIGDIEDTAVFMRRINDQLFEILAERVTIPKKTFKDKWLRRDWWMTADEAVKIGLADRVR
jgi:ATP-dependent Clp endopeptidase proteolytic subunit ClpP